MLTCFQLTKSRVTLFRPKIIVGIFLHLTVLFYEVIISQEKVITTEQVKKEKEEAYLFSTFFSVALVHLNNKFLWSMA